MKVKVLLGSLLLTFAFGLYWWQAKSSFHSTTDKNLTVIEAKTMAAAKPSIQPEPAATEPQVQQAASEILTLNQQPSMPEQALPAQLCASYSKPVYQLKDDVQLQQQLLQNNNLYLDSAALVIGSSNYSDAMHWLSASKTENDDFSTEQDIRDYLTQELSGEVYQLQLGCGIGVCMASIITGPNSDLVKDLNKIQRLGSSAIAEFDHPDHKEIRVIFLAGKNANNGMTGPAQNTAAPSH